MKKTTKILFPVDLSETSEKIVPWVKTMAARFEAEILLLFVARMFDYFVGLHVSGTAISNFENEVTRGGKRRLAEFQDIHFADTPGVTWEVTIGDPVEQIVARAKEPDIDFLVMGTHGRKGLDRIFFGSVANGVSKTATVPVLLVNPYRMEMNDQYNAPES